MEYEAEQNRLEELGIDGASDKQTVEALLKDEQSAVASYQVAIENLQGKISEKAIAVLEHILDEEKEHILELDKILHNEEDSIEL